MNTSKTTPYMIGALIYDTSVIDAINRIKVTLGEVVGKDTLRECLPTMRPHITFTPPFLASYEIASRVNLAQIVHTGKLFNEFNDEDSNEQTSSCTVLSPSWMKFNGIDILHLPVILNPVLKNFIDKLRQNILDNGLAYVNPIPDTEYYPHITIAKGKGLCVKQEDVFKKQFFDPIHTNLVQIDLLAKYVATGWQWLHSDPSECIL